MPNLRAKAAERTSTTITLDLPSPGTGTASRAALLARLRARMTRS